MEAFRHKPGYETAAGECVSLAALYAAAAFVVCQIPLEDIYMILTPLHSQNFIDLQDGVLTNNRRLVTMWFNGTAISNKAQRALRNENITIVAHSTGYVHCLYEDATIDRDAYKHFAGCLASYLKADLTLSVFASFLRSNRGYQKHFQMCRDCHGRPHFLKAEVLFHYEHGSNFRIADKTFDKLLAEVADEDFVVYELPGRIRCDRLEQFMTDNHPDLTTIEGKSTFKSFVEPTIPDAERFVNELADFLYTEAKLPAWEKNYLPSKPIQIPVDYSRRQVIERLQSIRGDNTTADLAFYAYRDMQTCDWRPFITAAIERNPVSLEMTGSMSIEQVRQWLEQMDNISIYTGSRLAQPDEVANYKTADGIEKAFSLANVIRRRHPNRSIEIYVDNADVTLSADGRYCFKSQKNLTKTVKMPAGKAATISD